MNRLTVPVSMKCKTDKPERHKDGSGHDRAMGVFPIEQQMQQLAIALSEAALLRRSEFAVQPASLFRFDWSSVSTFWTCSHLGHSKVSRSETAGPCSIRASIMGAWTLGKRGGRSGISAGPLGKSAGALNY